jgi:hypothetical protein
LIIIYTPLRIAPLNFPALLSAVAIWLTMIWIWIPCWFCKYKDRYHDDGRSFFDYAISGFKLQLQILVGVPLALACT